MPPQREQRVAERQHNPSGCATLTHHVTVYELADLSGIDPGKAGSDSDPEEAGGSVKS